MCSDSSNNTLPPDVLKAAFDLAQIIKNDSEVLDTVAWARGEKFLVIANDPGFTKSTAGLAEQKIKVIREAIDDLSDHGKVLSQAFMGLLFSDNEIEPFISQYTETPHGKVVFKIGIKDSSAFAEWRNGAQDRVSQDDINSAIYRLTALWAELL